MADAGEDNIPNKNWSSGFQRLRAEAVLLSIVIFTITHMELELKRIPLIGFESEAPIPRAALTIFLFVFFLYTTVHWCVKFKVEIAEITYSQSSIRQLLTDIKKNIEIAEGFTTPDITELSKSAAETEILISEYKENLLNFQKNAPPILKYISENFDTDKYLEAQLQEKNDEHIKSLYGDNPPREGIVFFPTGEMKQLAHMSIRELHETANRIEAKLEFYTQRLEQAESTIQRARTTIETDLEVKGPQITKSFEAVQIQFKELRNKFLLSNAMVSADKQYLSFWAPFVFASGLFLASLPQGWKDMNINLTSLHNCVSAKSWMRPPSPSNHSFSQHQFPLAHRDL